LDKLKTLKEEVEKLSSMTPEEYGDPVKYRKELEKKTRELEAKQADPIDGRDVYININMLYIAIKNHPALSKAQNPALMYVTLQILNGTDFFGDFSGDNYALFFDMGWEKCVWDTWCRYADRFSHMIMMFYSGETTFNQPELLRRVYVDEDAFVNFFYQCYATKYGNAIRANNPVSEEEYDAGKTKVRITPKRLEEHTASFMNKIERKPGEEDAKWEARFKKAKKKVRSPKFFGGKKGLTK